MFVLSNFSDNALKKKCERIINKLNGTIDNDISIRCTHIITPTVTGSAKCLGAIAAGKWLLKEGYIYESEKAGYFVDEVILELIEIFIDFEIG